MQRSNLIRRAELCLAGLITLILTAGCGHHTSSAVPAPAPVTTAAVPPVAPPAAFQPYTLLPSPPPPPPVAVPRHRVLHLTRVHDRVYLADNERHLYEAGRDPQGHIYPIYRDPATRVTYPLYYDASRDNLYRLARQQDGHFYRNYVGQPADQFSDTDRDYERIAPSDDDRPIVTDSYNTYNYNTYNNGPTSGSRYSNSPGYHPYYPYYAGYRPPPTHHASHFNNNWLWAIPVIIGAYLLLQPHHHSLPQPTYARQGTVVVNQITRVNIVNQITQAAPMGYRPIASPRPVYVLSPTGYTPQSGYRRPDVRPHGPIGAVAAAPVAVAAIRAAALARPVMHPALPVPNARPASFTGRPVPPAVAPRPVFRPRVQQARLAAPVSTPARHIPAVIHRPLVALPDIRPTLRHAETIRPRFITPHRQVRVFARPRVEHPRAIRASASKPRVLRTRLFRPAPAIERPHPVVRPVMLAHPHPAVQPRREELHAAPRIEHPVVHTEPRAEPVVMHSAPRIGHPATAPRRPETPRPAVRPHVVVHSRVVRAVTSVKPHSTAKRVAEPRKEEKPKDAVKAERR